MPGHLHQTNAALRDEPFDKGVAMAHLQLLEVLPVANRTELCSVHILKPTDLILPS